MEAVSWEVVLSNDGCLSDCLLCWSSLWKRKLERLSRLSFMSCLKLSGFLKMLAQVVLRSHIGVSGSFELDWKLVWMPLLEIVWRARPWETRLKVNVRMLCLWWCLVLRIRMQSEMVPLVGKKCLIYLHLNLPSSLKHLEKLFAFVGHFCLNWLFAFVGLLL